MSAAELSNTLQAMGDPDIASHSQRFFKTGPGEYGERDRFLGIRVPEIRRIARRYRMLPLEEIEKALASPYHEERLCALLILVEQFARGDAERQQEIYRLYLANTPNINNWDLVDASAHKIVGPYLANCDRQILLVLAQSENLWERRIAIMATYHFISRDDFDDTLFLAEQLLHDDEDLIHKAVGWMLREIGKRDLAVEEAFLAIHYDDMPRAMLRYAIEKFPEGRRQAYLRGEV